MQTKAKNIIIVAFLLLFISTDMHAQLAGIHSYSINEEGVAPKILTIYKSSQGFMLAGTSNGLYRFNGAGFIYNDFVDTVSKKAITAIAEDRDHKVWLGLQSGQIGYVQNKTVRILHAEEGHPSVAITSILQDTTGTLFFSIRRTYQDD